MNKKGFTLVEISVALVLLSLVMVFLLSFLKVLRKDENKIEEDTNMIILRNEIAKYINEDVYNNGGIIDVKCCSGNDCTYTCGTSIDSFGIYMSNGSVKKLELIRNNINVYDTIMYSDISNGSKIELKKTLLEGYAFNPLVLKQVDNLFYIKVPIQLHEEYDVDIVYNSINNN